MATQKQVKLSRTFHEGWQNFRRNGWLSVATVAVMTLSLFIVGLTIVFGVVTRQVLHSMEERINISIAFDPDVPEIRIQEIKSELEKYREVAAVEYISRDQALADFRAGSGNDPVITQALEEIGENPLLASLTIQADRSDQYDTIAAALQEAPFKDDMSRVNYEKNKKAIDRLAHINRVATRTGLVLGAIFIAVAVLVTFNSIRMNIYSRRQEFEIMRLVGASNLYVKMPSVFEGIFYGVTAAFLSLFFIVIALQFVSPLSRGAIGTTAVLLYAWQHLWPVIPGLFLMGAGFGALSASLALNRYLKN